MTRRDTFVLAKARMTLGNRAINSHYKARHTHNNDATTSKYGCGRRHDTRINESNGHRGQARRHVLQVVRDEAGGESHSQAKRHWRFANFFNVLITDKTTV